MPPTPPIIAIVGPTASGKTALSIAAAHALCGEIVSADSRQVYRGLDIGSAKVTSAEMEGVPHHLLDVADPHLTYTATDYERDASAAIGNIVAKQRLPIVVGGTFFYIQLLRGLAAPAPVPPNPELRARLEMLPLPDLQEQLIARSPQDATPDRLQNRRRLIRALEIVTAIGSIPATTPPHTPYQWHLYGLDVPMDVLTARIRERIVSRLDHGLLEEIHHLHHTVRLTHERLAAFGLEYRYGSLLLQGQLTTPEFIDTLTTKTRQFAKRQYTWLRREPNITWLPYPVDTGAAIQHMAQAVQSAENHV